MIQFQNVSFTYGGSHPAIDDLSFSIRDGESVGLIGANGAGKSTVMKLLTGLLRGRGEILVDGLPVEEKNLALIRRKVGLVMQDADNQMFMPTVYEDVLFGPLNCGLSREEAGRRADSVLERLGLRELKHRYNHRLSGGEKRMASLAAVLVMEPEVLLLDEPTSGLDPVNRRIVIRAMNGLSQTRVLAAHDLDMVLDTCRRVILLSRGRVAADGAAEDILRDRALLEANRMELPLRMQGWPGGPGSGYVTKKGRTVR